MGISLSKDKIIPLAKAVVETAKANGVTQEAATAQANALSIVAVGVGWDVSDIQGEEIDLDASVVPVDASGNAIPGSFVFYNQLEAFDGKIKHHGDNLTGKGEGDDETIDVNLDLPLNVAGLVFAVTIHDAESRGQSFEQVKDAFIRVVDKATGLEIARYELTKDAGKNDVMVFGELRRDNGTWNFAANSLSKSGGLDTIIADYKVSV